MIRWFIIMMVLLSVAPAWAQMKPSLHAVVAPEATEEGQPVKLTLQLLGANPVSEPNSDALLPLFEIQAKRYNHSLTRRGGADPVASHLWVYQLMPRRAGNLTIPAFNLLTDAGMVQSRAITLPVGHNAQQAKARASQPSAKAPEDIKIQTYLPYPSPYLGQAVQFDIMIYQGNSIVNLSMKPPTGDGLRMRAVTKPKSRMEIIGNKGWVKNEQSYVFAGVKTGKTKLDAIELTGQSQQMASSDILREMMLLPGMSASDILGQMMQGGQLVKDFTLSSEATALDIKPPPPEWQHGINRWLPAWHMEAQSHVDRQSLKAGEPILRDVEIAATGVFPESLPDIEQLHREALNQADWRIYANPPEQHITHAADKRTITSRIRQQLTLVPMHANAGDIPVIRIPWWSLGNHQTYEARLEAVSLQISGATARHASGKEAGVPSGHAAESSGMAWPVILAMLAFLGGLGWLGWQLYPMAERRIRMLQKNPAHLLKIEAWQRHILRANNAASLLDAVERSLPILLKLPKHEPLFAKIEQLTHPSTKPLAHLCRQLEQAAFAPKHAKAAVDIASSAHEAILHIKAIKASPAHITDMHKPHQTEDDWQRLWKGLNPQ